jgi:error-prone DNA polymerase
LSEDLLPLTLANADHCANPLPEKFQPEPFAAPGPGNRECGFHDPAARGHPRDVRIVPRMLPPARDFH